MNRKLTMTGIASNHCTEKYMQILTSLKAERRLGITKKNNKLTEAKTKQNKKHFF